METAFEQFGLALEAIPRTAIAAPTHYFPFTGMITPAYETYRRSVSDGTLENYISERRLKEWSTWTASGALDTDNAPVLFNMLVKSVTVPTTPTDGVLTRLWSFPPTTTSDAQKAASLWASDPNVQSFRTAGNYADTFEIAADGTGTDVALLTMSGWGGIMEKVADPTMPTQLVGVELPPLLMQCWMDTGATAIGTTAVTNRLLAATLSGNLTRTRKHIPGGPAAGLGPNATGVGKRNTTSALRFEVPDTTEWDLMAAGTPVKTRVRLNSDLIESVGVGPTLYYHYIQWDIYGILGEPAWGDFEGTNRTLDVTITSTKDTTAGHSWALYVQNDRVTL